MTLAGAEKSTVSGFWPTKRTLAILNFFLDRWLDDHTSVEGDCHADQLKHRVPAGLMRALQAAETTCSTDESATAGWRSMHGSRVAAALPARFRPGDSAVRWPT
jgi:hypothetical protein